MDEEPEFDPDHDSTKHLPWRMEYHSHPNGGAWLVLDAGDYVVQQIREEFYGKEKAEWFAKMLVAGSLAPQLYAALTGETCGMCHGKGFMPVGEPYCYRCQSTGQEVSEVNRIKAIDAAQPFCGGFQ